MKNYNKKYQVDSDLLAAVVHFTHDSIIVTSTNLDDPGPEIVYVNPGFTKMTGYQPEEVLGKSPRFLQGPKTDPNVLIGLRAKLESGDIFFGQAINYRKDGSEFWNEWHIEPIKNDQGQIIYYIAIQRDITDRKKSEKSLEQKNIALQEIVEQIEIEKAKIKKSVSLNVEEVLIPAFKKLKRKGTSFDKKYLDVLEQSLKDLTSSFGMKVSNNHLKLSPREVEIANLIKNGLSSKEIVGVLNISFKTVETHRNRIRQKLDITNTDINLTTYLQAL